MLEIQPVIAPWPDIPKIKKWVQIKEPSVHQFQINKSNHFIKYKQCYIQYTAMEERAGKERQGQGGTRSSQFCICRGFRIT